MGNEVLRLSFPISTAARARSLSSATSRRSSSSIFFRQSSMSIKPVVALVPCPSQSLSPSAKAKDLCIRRGGPLLGSAPPLAAFARGGNSGPAKLLSRRCNRHLRHHPRKPHDKLSD